MTEMDKLFTYCVGFPWVRNPVPCWQSRGVYETPGGTILHTAHTDLETYCLDREVLRVKSFLQDKMADYVYNGNDLHNLFKV